MKIDLHANIYSQLQGQVALVESITPERNSIHECLGYIEEEYHELKMEIFKKRPNYNLIAEEAIDQMVTLVRLVKFCQEQDNIDRTEGNTFNNTFNDHLIL